MASGYVLDFSNRTFDEFFREVVNVQIYDPKFDLGSGSKANRMRAFWKVATDNQVCTLLSGLLEAWDIYATAPISDSAKQLIEKIIVRLSGEDSNLPKKEKESKKSNNSLDDELSKQLVTKLLEVTAFPPQKRGYEFEGFLRELFDAYDLSARASFRITGEQIDGSFVLHNETYLLEAKWQNSPIGAADLHTFEGKLREKASWTRGLFISNSGFTPEGIHAFGRGKRLICMDGLDLSEMLRLRMSIVEVLEAKIRGAGETGNPYIPVRDLFY